MKKLHTGYRLNAGYTILELMVAASIFTIVLLVVAVGVISYSNSYFKGITSSKAQAATRSTMNEIVASLQFGTKYSVLTPVSGVQAFCVDNTLYAYKIGQEVTDTGIVSANHQGLHALVVYNGSDCSGGPIPGWLVNALASPGVPWASGTNARELLGVSMRLSDLTVTQQNNLYTVHLRVIYGDDDLLNPVPTMPSPPWATTLCASGPGQQFCAVSDLSTTAEKRIL